MNDILSDFRFGLRMLRKRLGTSALAVVALALGIGLTTMMFSIVQGVILRGLPFDESDRIAHLGRVVAGGTDVQTAPLHDYVDWNTSQQSFESLSAFANAQGTISDEAGSERYRMARITPNTLRVLRIAPVIGRDFTEADGQPGAPPVVIIGDQAWTSQFQRSPSVVNRAVRLNGTPATIIGVMPPRFGFPNAQQIWTPLQVTLAAKRGEGQTVDVIGRLKPESSYAHASAEFEAIGRRLREAYPENKDTGVLVQPFMSRFVPERISRTLFAMLAAVFGVMLIACTNVANLQLARAAERMREVALRMALGAGRLRIVRQMLVEGLVLATAGAFLGLGIASVGIALFNRNIVDTAPPFWIDIRLDPTVLAFATVLTCVAALAASLIPALRATKQDVNAVLKDEGRGNTGLHMGRFSRGLVIVEVLLSCSLLIVSGLMIKGVVSLGRMTYPYPTTDIFVAQLSATGIKYPQDAERAQLAARVESAFTSIPGVRDIALSSGTPESNSTTGVAIEGATYATPRDQPSTRQLAISPRFFEVLRVRALSGRVFSPLDNLSSERVAIVGQDFAQKHFPGIDPLGRRIRFGDATKPWLSIVGVVPRLAPATDTATAREVVYVPLAQSPQLGLTILASTTGNPLSLTSGLRRAAVTVDEDLALSNPNSLAGQYWSQSWAFRVFGSVFMSFGFAALLLASAGLYGVMAFSVRRRTNEIGVRMALGANRGLIVRMVLFQGMWRCALGVALGLGPAWFLGNAMRDLLFNVTPTDPLVVSMTTIGLLSAGFVASLVPAMRAASVDPLVALRHE